MKFCGNLTVILARLVNWVNLLCFPKVIQCLNPHQILVRNLESCSV